MMPEKNREKKKYKNKRNFYLNLHINDHLDIEFTAYWGELMPEEALTSFTVSNAYR